MRRRRRILSALLITAGLLMLADVAATLLWQEPVTAVVALLRRSGIDRRYLSYATMPLSAAQQASLTRYTGTAERIAYLASAEQRSVPDGAAVGRLVITKLGVDYEVVQGTSASDLQLGPAHYRSTPLPGLGGTVAIAGHRTTYLAPFRNLNELAPGDRLRLLMPYGTFVYSVQRQQIVPPNAWWITRSVGYPRLVLSACNPLYSANQRIAVFARLIAVKPARVALNGRPTNA